MGNTKKLNNLMYQKKGYTIVETLIFLAVSSVLAVSALALMSGRQRSTEFTQAVNDLESQLRDVANDVNTGYFPNPGNISCAAPGANAAPELSEAGSAQQQGTNSACIYVGRVVQFTDEGAVVYSALGRRQANGTDVTDIISARPKLIAKANAADTITPESIERINISPAIDVASVKYTDNSGNAETAVGVAFFTTFGKTNAVSSSASLKADIVPAPIGTGALNFNSSQYEFVTNFNNFYADWVPSQATNTAEYQNATNTAGGVEICVNGDGVKRYAIIRLGAQSASGSSTTIEIKSDNGGVCP